MTSAVSKMAPTSHLRSPSPQHSRSTVLLHRLSLSCTKERTSRPQHRPLKKTTRKHPLNYPRGPPSSCILEPIISLQHNCSRSLISLKQ